MSGEDKKILDNLKNIEKERQESLNKAKSYLDNVNQQRDPQIYKEVLEEINAREKELNDANKDVMEFQKIANEIEDIAIEKLEEEKGIKERALNKARQQLKMVDQQRDPQTYQEGLEEVNAREKELKEINDRVNNANQEIKKLQEEKSKILAKYKFKSDIDTNRENNNQNQRKEAPTNEGNTQENEENNRRLEQLKIDQLIAEREAKRKELDTLRKSIVNNGGQMTPEQIDKIKAIKNDIKRLDKEIQDIKDGKNQTQNEQPSTEEKNQEQLKKESEQLKIEDKHKDQLKIEDKHKDQLRIEDKHKDQLRIEHKEVPLLEYHEEKPIVHPNVSIEKTGLQVFREQYNQMPEIKGRHALSENPFLKLPAAIAPAVATLAITGGVAALPVTIGVGACAAVYAAYKPIIRKVTGQAKIEKKIQKQFEDLIKENPEEFDKMAHYLTEENIVSLKPHCAILNALVKASQTRCKDEIQNIINPQLKDATDTINKLSQKGIENLTDKEKSELIQANKTREDLEKQKQDLLKNAQEIKDGTKSKSAEIKGNMKGSKLLNLFARRNHTTKQYKDKLNDYADAERAADEEKVFADYERAQGNIDEADKREAQSAIFKNLQHDIMKENSYAKHGVHKSVFNGSKDGSTVQAISRIPDQTIKHIGMLVTTAAGLYRVITNMNKYVEMANQNADIANQNAAEAQRIEGINNTNVDNSQNQVDDALKNFNLSDKDAQSIATSDAANIANANEMTGVHSTGTVRSSNAQYHQYDEYANLSASQNESNISGQNLSNLNFGDKLRYLASWKRSTGNAVQDTANSMNGMQLNTDVDHTAQENLMNDAQNGNDIQATLMEKMADAYDKLKAFNPGQKVSANVVQAMAKIKKDFLGPAATALGSVMSIASDRKKIRQETKWNNKNHEATEERD